MHQDASKTPPKTPPRRPQDAPRRRQDAPRQPQDSPKIHQKPSKNEVQLRSMLGTPLGTLSGGAFTYKTPTRSSKKTCFNIEREARCNEKIAATRVEYPCQRNLHDPWKHSEESLCIFCGAGISGCSSCSCYPVIPPLHLLPSTRLGSS